jgi:hypothetical protein
MDDTDRLIPLDGAFNFRDLGGYPAVGGRRTRWGRLFRSDTLHELSPSDVERLRTLGLASIVDLRTERELLRTGRGPLEPEPITYRHLSVLGDGDGDGVGSGEAVAAPPPVGDDLAERYLWYLEVGKGALAEALGLLSETDNLPLVFHCAAGKDRTGVLAALVLDILGVDPGVIVADYLITAGRMELIMDRFRADPVLAERMSTVPGTRFSVEAGTMERFLDELHRRYGGARAWAEASGIGADALDRMMELLLEPAAGPGEGTSPAGVGRVH